MLQTSLRRLIAAALLTTASVGIAAPPKDSGSPSEVLVVNTDASPAAVRVTQVPAASPTMTTQSFSATGSIAAYTPFVTLSASNQVLVTHLAARIILPQGQRATTYVGITSGGSSINLPVTLTLVGGDGISDYYELSMPVDLLVDPNAKIWFQATRSSSLGNMNGLFTIVGRAL